MATIYHITTTVEWEQAQQLGHYRADSLRLEGFVHCSEAHQVVRVANFIFRGVQGLVLLHVDTDRLRARLVYENLDGGDELFPHVYGPIALEAVSRVTPFEPGDDGGFEHHEGAFVR